MKRLSIVLIFLIGSLLSQAQHLAPTRRVLVDTAKFKIVSVINGEATFTKKYTDSSVLYVIYTSHTDTVKEQVSVFSSNKTYITSIENDLKKNKIKYIELFPMASNGKKNYYDVYWNEYFIPSSLKN